MDYGAPGVFSSAKRHNDTCCRLAMAVENRKLNPPRRQDFDYVLLVLPEVTCNLVFQKTRKEMESQIRKQKLRQISSAASLPNLSKVSLFHCFILLLSFSSA